MTNTLFKYTIFLITALTLTSCAGRTIGTGEYGLIASEIIEKVELYQSSIKSVKGLARVNIKTADSKVSYTQVTIASVPDLLRLEALNPFGNTVGFISSDGHNIYIISDTERGVYEAGETFYLSYVYPGLDLAVTAESLTNLILGKLPYKVFNAGADVSVQTDGGNTLLVINSENGRAADKIWLNAQNSLVEKAELTLQYKETVTIEYKYFEGLKDGYYFPKIVDFESGDLAITITYEDDVELNTGVDKNLFKPVS